MKAMIKQVVKGYGKKYHISFKQYVEHGIEIKILSGDKPDIECVPSVPSLEDAYLRLTRLSCS